MNTTEEDLRGGGQPATITTSVRTVLDRFTQLETVAGVRGHTGDRMIDQVSVIERPAVVSIFGEHGSGKSTLLRFACAALDASDERIVLPIVSPERFAPGDTLFGWVLAGLRTALVGQPSLAQREVEIRGRRLRAEQQVELLTRQEALARSDFKEQTPPAVFSPDEWAEGLAAVTAAGLELVEGWNALMDTLTRTEGDAPSVQRLVVPVDDADQAPTVLHSIMRDLRWITTHPSVGALLCASHGTLLEVLRASPEFSELSDETSLRQAREVILKVLPRNLRVTVELLRPPERLAFAPLGESETLQAMLERFSLPGRALLGLQSLGSYFTVSVAGERVPSNYAELLSPVPRQLEQLWRALDALSRSGRSEAATRDAAEMVLQRALEPQGPSEDELPRTIELDEDGARIDYEVLNFGLLQGRGVMVYRDRSRNVGVRVIRGYSVKYARPEEETVGPDLPKHFAFAHHLLRELGDQVISPTPVIEPFAYYGAPPIVGGSNWNLNVEVQYEDGPTDNAFLAIPMWDSMYDSLVFSAAWNRQLQPLLRAQQSDLSTMARTGNALEWLIITHLRLVVAVQRTRTAPSDLIHSDIASILERLEGWDRDAEILRLRSELEYPSKDPIVVRASDFDLWVDAYIPWAADPVFCPPELGEGLLRMRDELVEEAGTKERADLVLVERLSSRVHRHIGAPWIGSAINLLARYDPDRARDLAGAHEVARGQDQAESRTFARALQERGVPADVVGRLLISGVTDDMVMELRGLGMAEPAIAVLAERFPPPPAEGDLTRSLGRS